MSDEVLDWIEDHRGLIIGLVVVVIIIGIMFGIRTYNLSKKSTEQVDNNQQQQQVVTQYTQEPVVTEEPSYESSLANRVEDKKKDSTKKNKVEKEEVVKEIVPNIEVSCNVFTKTRVPNRNVDGSSCKSYLNGVTLADFDTFWGDKLDVNDMKSETKYLVGVDQDDIDVEIADLQSVGWLISNFNKLKKHDAIKFTNLHVIGKLSDDHVAVLCSYDWYSVFGMKDTLVVFEDISGTLKKKDFKAGAVFSATVFVHNMKVVKVNGQNVVCVQYNTYD